jgi:hypothetical protein
MLVRALFYTLRTGPRVQRASGIPCALYFERAKSFQQASGGSRREIAFSYLAFCAVDTVS